MTNDEWIAFLDRLAPEQRAAVEQARTHFGAVYDGTVAAFLKMLGGLEDSYAGLNHSGAATSAKQDLITEHLKRQDQKFDLLLALPREVEAVQRGLVALTDEFRANGEQLDEWRAKVEAQLEDFRQSRERSIKERQELRVEMAESKADRAQIHRDLTVFHDELKAMKAQIDILIELTKPADA